MAQSFQLVIIFLENMNKCCFKDDTHRSHGLQHRLAVGLTRGISCEVSGCPESRLALGKRKTVPVTMVGQHKAHQTVPIPYTMNTHPDYKADHTNI